jgi:hypothetical protein
LFIAPMRGLAFLREARWIFNLLIQSYKCMPELPAEILDNEFWLLAKQCEALGYTPQSGDTTFSLRARLLEIFRQGGGGGGGTDPGAVQKIGDTMSGQLVIKGDQFSSDQTNATPLPALLIEDSAGTAQVGLALGEFGDGLGVFRANGQPGKFRLANGSEISMFYAGGRLVLGAVGIDFNDSAGFHVTLTVQDTFNQDLFIRLSTNAGITLDTTGDGGVRGRLYFDTTTGDLMVEQSVGPHAGQSVNLTAGNWV